MTYNFDEIIERRHTDSLKWDALKQLFGHEDVQPLWVADMDFRTPPFILDAIRHIIDQGVLGYTLTSDEWSEAVVRWQKRRYGVDINKEELTFIPGIVRGMAFAVQALTNEGDKVMVQPPVYHPFFLTTRANHRQVVFSPLTLGKDNYMMDFNRFREDIKGCKMFLLCNPHNPGGRVWTSEELATVAQICQEEGAVVVSDQIHADLTLPGYHTTDYNAASPIAANHSVVLGSPSKAFNMPGLSSSFAVVKNPDLRQRFFHYLESSELNMGNMFACRAAAAAYNHGEQWLGQMLDYLNGNMDFLQEYLRTELPMLSMIRPQASYLVYLDCRKLHLTQKELVSFFLNEAHLALSDGMQFGDEGRGFMRMNVGCPRSVLQKCFQQLRKAIMAR